MATVENIPVGEDEAGLRLDRWFKAHYPGLAFGALQKLVRTGQVRVDGKRVETSTRLVVGQVVRVPPGAMIAEAADAAPRKQAPKAGESDADFLRSITLFEDKDVLVLNKPPGLAVQGGSGLTRHVDAMLESLKDAKGQVPRLVHRLDRETSGCLVVAKTRSIAAELAATFRSRSARKIYWALVAGVPKPHQGRISTWLARDEADGERMKVARHDDEPRSSRTTSPNYTDSFA